MTSSFCSLHPLSTGIFSWALMGFWCRVLLFSHPLSDLGVFVNFHPGAFPNLGDLPSLPSPPLPFPSLANGRHTQCMGGKTAGRWVRMTTTTLGMPRSLGSLVFE